MAADSIILSWGPGETRIALLLDGHPVEFRILREGQAYGGIWRGRVVGVNRALGAAFVDIGLARPGFLPAKALHEGQSVLVQATADPRPGKGAKLGTEISLPGRYAVYLPQGSGLFLSKRLDPERRERLERLGWSLLRPDEGAILRHAAAGVPEEKVAAELAALRALWQASGAASDAAPRCLIPPDPVAALLADNPGVDMIQADDAALVARLRAAHPDIALGQGDVFARHGLDEALEEALAPEVPMEGGGSIAIESTRALTAIDVDSGAAMPARANEAAVSQVARQLRLRGIGGQIMVDFVSDKRRESASRLAAQLRQAVAADPNPTHILGATALGLVEMTRERRHAGLAEMMLDPAASRVSAETMALAALKLALRETAATGRSCAIACAPEVARALDALSGPRAEAETRLGQKLALRPDPARSREAIDAVPL